MVGKTHEYTIKAPTAEKPDDSFTLVDIPAGTLLFHAFCLEEGDPRLSNFFKPMLGFPSDDGYCLSDIYSVYTFPFPYVGFGILDFKRGAAGARVPTWQTFNAFSVFVTTRDYSFVSMILPSPDFRGTWHSDGNIIQKCSKFLPTMCYDHIADEAVRGQKIADFQKPLPGDDKPPQHFDNCLVPWMRHQHNVAGTISIASLDALPREPGRKQKNDFDDSLGKYLRLLDPVKQTQILTHLYVDEGNTRGIPEISIHPDAPVAAAAEYKGRVVSHKPATTLDESIHALESFLGSGGAFLPIATITQDGIYTEGGGRPAGLGPGGLDALDPDARHRRIEENLSEFMRRALNNEINGALGPVEYDRRTGFYVASAYHKGQKYYDYLHSLTGRDTHKYATDYAANNREPTPPQIFDTYFPKNSRESIDRRLFIFKRPSSLANSFRDAGIDVRGFPRYVQDYFRMNTVARRGGTRGSTRRKMRGGLTSLAKTGRTAKTGPGRLRFTRTVKGFTPRNKSMEPVVSEPAMLIPEPSPLPEGVDRDLQKIYSALGPMLSEAIQRSVKEYRETK
jgi:hypothetical protein